MIKTRRKFIKTAGLGAIGATLIGCSEEITDGVIQAHVIGPKPSDSTLPKIISTWNHGYSANAEAVKKLKNGGTVLDAVEAGVKDSESEPENQSVGLGGLPDRDGHVTLDACIMDHNSKCGAVSFLQHIENPIAVARKVMEETPHVMLSGKGALEFALDNGFEKTNLLTVKSKTAWEEWKLKSEYQPVINRENHDTIGMLGIDSEGRLAGACTTSGLAYKMHGRVGDSPIIGAGLFVDGDVGAACATGVGEAVIRISGSAIVVELMRSGATPEEACKEVVERIMRKHEDLTGMQVGFLALDKFGNSGGYSIYEGFNYAEATLDRNEMVSANYFKKW